MNIIAYLLFSIFKTKFPDDIEILFHMRTL